MLKIVLGILAVIVIGMLVYAMIAWRDEMKDWPKPEACDPDEDDTYCSHMDEHL